MRRIGMADLGKNARKNLKKISESSDKNSHTKTKDKTNRKKSIVSGNEDNDIMKTIQNKQTIQSKIEACFESFLQVLIKICYERKSSKY